MFNVITHPAALDELKELPDELRGRMQFNPPFPIGCYRQPLTPTVRHLWYLAAKLRHCLYQTNAAPKVIWIMHRDFSNNQRFL
jgi:hypothetical protein